MINLFREEREIMSIKHYRRDLPIEYLDYYDRVKNFTIINKNKMWCASFEIIGKIEILSVFNCCVYFLQNVEDRFLIDFFKKYNIDVKFNKEPIIFKKKGQANDFLNDFNSLMMMQKLLKRY